MLYYGVTDVGMKRLVNQDSFSCESIGNIVFTTVCDGMGGAAGGSTASSLALRTFIGFVRDNLSEAMFDALCSGDNSRNAQILNIMSAAAAQANKAVYEMASSDSTLSGMGTTLVSAIVTQSFVYAVNIGDSRLYHFENGKAVQITRDHSYVQQLLDLGKITPEEARSNPHKNIITKAVGISEGAEPDTFCFAVDKDKDTYILLCSDGLTNFISDDDICNVLFGDNDNCEGEAIDALKAKADELVVRANKNGGADNITCTLVYLPIER